MIEAGTKFEFQGKTLEALPIAQEEGCTGCIFDSDMGCVDPNHDHDCYDPNKKEYVIFKEVTE